MSTQEMKRFNIKSVREYGDEILICDIAGDEWRIVGNTLYHRCNRHARGKVEFNYQK